MADCCDLDALEVQAEVPNEEQDQQNDQEDGEYVALGSARSTDWLITAQTPCQCTSVDVMPVSSKSGIARSSSAVRSLSGQAEQAAGVDQTFR